MTADAAASKPGCTRVLIWIVARDLEAIPLPPSTEYVAQAHRAAKLVGNGNGMQYLGAILIRSDLSLAELSSYYEGVDVGDSSGITVVRSTDGLPGSDHYSSRETSGGAGGIFTEPPASDRFIVWVWGTTSSYVLKDLDIRGH